MSWQNFVFVVLLWPLIGMQNHSHSISTHIIRTALLRFPAHCCSHSWPTCSSHENFWPRSENCLCSRTWSLISTPYLPCKQQVTTSNTGPILVFPGIQPPLHLWIVRIPQYLLSWNTVRFQQHSGILHPYKISLNLSCCDNFSIRSPYLCNRRSLRARSSQSKGTSVLITLGTNEELDCPPTTGCPVLSWKVSYSSHISATAP